MINQAIICVLLAFSMGLLIYAALLKDENDELRDLVDELVQLKQVK